MSFVVFMRISIDCRALCESYATGVSHYTRELLRAIFMLPESSEHEWILFVNGFQFRSDIARARLMQIADFSKTPNITWRFTTIPSKLFTAAAIVIPFFSPKAIVGDSDVLFLPNIDFFPFRHWRIPMALTVHDLSFALYPELFPLKDRARYRLLRPYSFMKKCQALLAVSEHTRSDLKTYLPCPAADKPERRGLDLNSPRRIEVVSMVYPGNDHHIPEHDDDVFRARLPAQYILIVGNIEPRKNILTARAALYALRRDPRFANIKLVLAGASGSHRRITRVFANDNAIQLHGYLSEQQKWTALRHARVLLYPSIYEGFGFPPLEAQRVGVPVVCGAHSSFPEVIGDSGLMVDVTDVHAITRALASILTEQTLREEYIHRGIRNSQRFLWKTSAQKTLDILSSIRYYT